MSSPANRAGVTARALGLLGPWWGETSGRAAPEAAAALLAARCTALDFDVALAGRIVRGELHSPGFSSPAGTKSLPL